MVIRLSQFLNLLLLGTLLSCSSIPKKITTNDTLTEDGNYYPVYEKFTKKYEIVNNFETHHIIQVTFLHPDFLKELSNRHKKLYRDNQSIFQDASEKYGYFISSYSKFVDSADLAQKEYWNIKMTSKDKKTEPVILKELKNKEKWKPFFTNISPWTREYLVIFDIPISENSNKLVESVKNFLSISNSAGNVIVTYN